MLRFVMFAIMPCLLCFDINFGQTLKQNGQNANVRKQEKEIAISVVLIVG